MKTLLTRFRLWLAVKLLPLPQIQISGNLFEAIPPAATRVFDPVDHANFWATAQPAPTSKQDAPNLTINKITISDRGDASVGINGDWWELDFHGMEIDGDNLELLRADLRKLYNSWTEFPADDVEFDFETAKRMQSEREHDLYVDYCEAARWPDESGLSFDEWKAMIAQRAQIAHAAKHSRAYAEMLLADPAPFDDQPVSVPMLAATIFMLFVVAILAV